MAYLAAYLVFTGKSRDSSTGFGGDEKKQNGSEQSDLKIFNVFHNVGLWFLW
jgi:hypothetical protein